MSIKSIPSLLTLPVEVFYCILDQLDAKDILLSFRNVCTHFRAITDTYNRYKIQFTSTSPEADIRLACRMIRPENVISCVLTNTSDESDYMTGRIQLFLSLIDIRQFTHLQSLDLFYKGKCDFNKLMSDIFCVSTLMSLSLRWTPTVPMTHDIIGLLSAIIDMPSFRKLHLAYIDPEIYKIPRPNQCKLKELTIDNCSHEKLCDVLHHLSNLRSFSSNYYHMDETDQIVFSTSFQLLTSLTLRSPYMLIDQLESLLSFTPSLVYLHIVNHSSTLSFLQRLSQWEQFIRHKLPLLEKFKFYAYTHDYHYENVKDIELIINAFRTSFWLEDKHWYVTCKYINNDTRSGMMLYSPTASSIDFPDNLWPGILSYSTSTTKNDDIAKTSSTWNARLNLSAMNDAISSHKVCGDMNSIGFSILNPILSAIS